MFQLFRRNAEGDIVEDAATTATKIVLAGILASFCGVLVTLTVADVVARIRICRAIPECLEAHPELKVKPIRNVVVDYRIRFDWVYTGTSDSYNEYSGQMLFQAKEPDGLPIHSLFPEATIIPFNRLSGGMCELHVGPQDGAIFCPNPYSVPHSTYPMTTLVKRLERDSYVITAMLW